MYSIRPYASENADMDLPTTMYKIQPLVQSVKSSTNESALKDIEHRQDILLEKIEVLYNQLVLYQNQKTAVPILEPLVVHLSAKQPSKSILDFIEKFREKLSIRTHRHSSVRDQSFNNKLQNSPTTSTNRPLTIVWAEGDELPYMFHSQMKITKEQEIVNFLSHQLTKNA